jgi:uncharacterized SAM-binding protein YcdF (DUF218 family)
MATSDLNLHASRNSTSRSRKWRVALRWAALAASAFLIIVGLFILTVGRWLVVEDPLEKATAIAVLSGKMPIRAVAAAEIYSAGYAREIWLTHSAEPAATMRDLHVPFNDETFYNTQVLIQGGVPPQAVLVLAPFIVNTADELDAIAAALPRDKSGVVIIVTTKSHTRRVRALWKRLGAARGRAVIRAADKDPFDPAHWWRTSGDALDVLRECFGLLNVWFGLPLHGS